MYQASQIRNLPLLSDDEKVKYEAGLNSLWQRMNNSPANSPGQREAQQKIMEFSRMLINKIQGRRAQAQAQQQQQQQAGQGQGQQQAAQQKSNPAAGGDGGSAPNGTATANAQAGASAPAAQTTQATTGPAKPKLPDHILTHVNKMTFTPPPQVPEKTPAEAAKWVAEMKERYGRALFAMESARAKVTAMDKLFNDRTAQGNPFNEEEQRKYRMSREQQMKMATEAQKFVEMTRQKQLGMRQAAGNQNAQNAQAGAGQKPEAQAANRAQQNTPNATAAANTAVEGAKGQQAAGNRPSPSNGTPTPQQQQQQQARMAQNAAQQNQAANQGQVPKQEPGQPAPVNTTMAAAQTPAQGVARVQTPQSATQATAGGPTRALSHSAAMSLANQRAAATPTNGGMAAPQQAGTPTPGGAGNNGVNAAQPPAGHTHAHPPQQPAPLQSKMPIPKQLPERATAVPQGVAVGGGVASGRPTMSQGSGTLGGVLNQPAVPKIPAYSHDAEGDHVLSKKKLDELVRQVCGAPPENQEANLLSPEVEEVRTLGLHASRSTMMIPFANTASECSQHGGLVCR